MSEDFIQGSDEWKAARCGLVTASRVADVIAKTKSGWGASRANYLAELVAERLTGEPAVGFTSSAMQWGTEKEPEARAAYEFQFDVDVELVGFVKHPTIAGSGASPDGLVSSKGMIEIKCPNTSTHIDTLLDGAVPAKYVTQAMWQMACTGREWVDFVSYDPRLPGNMRLFIQRIQRDHAVITQLETAVTEFLRELDDKVMSLRAKYEKAAA
jgi:putative phage-type endonuclease